MGLFKTVKFAQPVIVIGNLSVGGSGKTPLVIHVSQLLLEQGYQPGVVSRGYGGKAATASVKVDHEVSTTVCGDEAMLIYRRLKIPVVVDPNRSRGVNTLIDEYNCDVIVSDDGLQHYAMDRQIEIAVIGPEYLGNGFCLPAGPLREPPTRLNTVDLVVCNGCDTQPEQYAMSIDYGAITQLNSGTKMDVESLKGRRVHGVAGIGYPERFFQFLAGTGCELIEHVYPDHHAYDGREFVNFGDELVVMTEKDAVKWMEHPSDNLWYIPITVHISKSFDQEILRRLSS